MTHCHYRYYRVICPNFPHGSKSVGLLLSAVVSPYKSGPLKNKLGCPHFMTLSAVFLSAKTYHSSRNNNVEEAEIVVVFLFAVLCCTFLILCLIVSIRITTYQCDISTALTRRPYLNISDYISTFNSVRNKN